MRIHCNDEQLEVPEDCSLVSIIQRFNEQEGALAVAVNQTIIPTSRWQLQTLEEGDVVDIFTLVAGG
ncbi:sulfur carrier protein ThiS [Alteromonas confluentis]|uniref:Thiamine biosynthesis protein ThiS n=1 Tax=Alteromonas confluentis TaxID=1656094 RepID=A0A1E7Z9Q3_9ALTE|nr:sulfur carrier protein ThiS [Alteromonas confluentis]OFC70258.1 thiamine biosynthesis protein ThiS [Alteromonas confluentis]